MKNQLPSYFQAGSLEVLRSAAPDIIDLVADIVMFEIIDKELVRRLNLHIPMYLNDLMPESSWAVFVPDQMDRFVETSGFILFITQTTEGGKSIYYPLEIRPAVYC